MTQWRSSAEGDCDKAPDRYGKAPDKARKALEKAGLPDDAEGPADKMPAEVPEAFSLE